MGKPALTYTHDGATRTIAQWAEHLGITIEAMRKRVRRWPTQRAVTEEGRAYTMHGDLTGRRFGMLVVLRREPPKPRKQPQWVTRCDCGAQHVAACYGLVTGSTKSCGCHRGRPARSERG